jgi:hypothetical protein
MRVAIPPLSQYAFMAWWSVKAKGFYLTLTSEAYISSDFSEYVLPKGRKFFLYCITA